MATRSTIAIENVDGTITSVYCHWDGYLSHNGEILQYHYHYDKLAALISNGYMSSLHEEIEHCKFYKDHGEGLTSNTYKDYYDYLNSAHFEEYNYILRLNKVWYVSKGSDNFHELSIMLEKEMRGKS
jgi:hypothetical protein